MANDLTKPAVLATTTSKRELGSVQPVTIESRKTATAARTESRRPPRQAEKTRDLASEVNPILDEIADDVAQALWA